MPTLKSFLYKSFCFFLVATNLYGQQAGSPQTVALANRVQPAPEGVLSRFREAGMQPVNHVLTEMEKNKVSKAFAALPALHQKVLKEHLHSISFMDNMPNTALTSTLETSGTTKMFNITFRAEILKETISEWATWKENTCYVKSENNEYEIIIDAGKLDAMLYILLHEATHVVDAVLNIAPHPDDIEAEVPPTPFTANVWHKMNEPVEKFVDPLLETTRFRSGNAISISSALNVYEALQETPFASLYSMASWHEDLAEILTIYHLTSKMKQPYKIFIKKNEAIIYTYEPFMNKQVVNRRHLLAMFYY
jgi:hypothetical protein